MSSSWDELSPNDILLSTSYLRALEQANPSNIQLHYLEVYNGGTLAGIAVIQIVQLYLNDMFRNRQVSCVKEFFRDCMSRVINGNLLVVGNLTHTGQHAVCNDENHISIENFYREVFKAIKELRIRIKSQNKTSIRAVMLKDFFPNDPMLHASVFQNEYLHKVEVQPNMLLDVKPEWNNIEDYVSDLSKKYRDRFKRAKRKRNGIVAKELSLEDIEENEQRIYQLYLNVSKNAKFNTFTLPENHFYVYKKNLKDDFRVFGYYLKHELLGFYTLILNKHKLETYFLGYDEVHQYDNQLYLNMLYDMLKFAINHNFKQIVYARTAVEIKSSIGAKPKPMIIYLKHTNAVINVLLRPIFKLMDPTEKWKERHPFKHHI